MTNTVADSRGAVLAVSVAGVAAAAWVVAARRMSGMDMGPGTDLGSLSFFVATWATMMAAMMLPSALPAVLSVDRTARHRRRVHLLSPIVFVLGYLAVWTAVGVAAFLAYRAVRAAQLGFLGWSRDGAYVAGAAVVVAGVYEVMPLKRACLRRCRAAADPAAGKTGGAALRYAGSCVGCSAGLMLVLFSVGVMSLFWMVIVTVLVFAQRVPSSGARLVVPVALLLVGLGVWIGLSPSSVPELTLPM